MRALAFTALFLVMLMTVASPAAACEQVEEPAFSRAAAKEGVVGVVERETLASNPLPWGASIGVATRIWGGIRADRWKVSDRQFVSCPNDPPTGAGSIEYDFRGAEADWGGQRHAISDIELNADEILLLETRFGVPESFEVSGVDRAMAVVRVWGFELTAVAVAVALGSAALWRERRRRRYDRTLF